MRPSLLGPVILVEDNADDIDFVTRALTAARIGNPLVVYASPAEAEAALVERGAPVPVLLILDVRLPGGMSGLELLRRIRRQPAPLGTTPAIMLTGSGDPDDQESALDLGALTCVRKPVSEALLVRAVRALQVDMLASVMTRALQFRLVRPV